VLGLQSAVFAFADNEKEVQIPYYVAVGDSIASGFGLRGDDLDQLVADMDFMNNVVHNCSKTSYPYLVADAIAKQYGLESTSYDLFANVGAIGFEIEDYVKVLNMPDNELKDYVSKFWTKFSVITNQLTNPGKEINWDEYKWGRTIKDEIKKADVISFHIGANDILQPFFNNITEGDNLYLRAAGYLLKLTSLEMSIPEMIQRVDLAAFLESDSTEDISSRLSVEKLIEAISFINLDEFSKVLVESVSKMTDSYEEVLKKIIELNPDAKIVVVGVHNPYGVGYKYRNIANSFCEELRSGQTCLTKEAVDRLEYLLLHFALGETISDAINALNDMQRSMADKYGLEFVYTLDKLQNTARIAVHPNAKQHEQIAAAIIDVIIPELKKSDSVK